MCGIVGVMNFDGAPVDGKLLVRMRDTMTHRGPDDAGHLLDTSVGLGHRRLSIIDLTPAGHQPMPNEDETVWLVFNGEIYNYIELRADLERRGHRFRSDTDSEVIIHQYEERGEECVEALNGMFGFLIWDARKQLLFGARDRLGIKPFYYYLDRRRFIAASEIKAIIEDPSVPREVDRAALADYMFAGTTLGTKTPFAGISELPPGSAISVRRGGKVTTRKYWDVVFDYRQRTDEQVVDELASLLDDSVRIHCRSDAPLGCHLSGGLDSSSIVGLASRHRDPLQTFSIRFDEGGSWDETPYAKTVAHHVGAEYLETTVVPEDLSALLVSLIWHMDTPLLPGTGGFSYYTVSRLAAQHVKVSLTGHGGDEVFAGYPAQFAAAFGRTDMFDLKREPVPTVPLAQRLRTAIARGGLLRRLRRALQVRGRGALSLEDVWVRSHCGVSPPDNPLLHPDFRRSLGGYSPRDEYVAPLEAAATDAVLDRCLYHDLRSYLPGLLHQEDRVSMAVSLESRVPLLDHRVVDFMATVPPEQKVTGMVPKALLRRAASRWIPHAIADRRDKTPFAVPASIWFQSDLAPFVRDILSSETCVSRGIFDPRELRASTLNRATLWAILTIELWFRLFIDREPATCSQIPRAREQVVSLSG